MSVTFLIILFSNRQSFLKMTRIRYGTDFNYTLVGYYLTAQGTSVQRIWNRVFDIKLLPTELLRSFQVNNLLLIIMSIQNIKYNEFIVQ